ncbi:MAG: phosphodiester glycosidase family protein [Oscillospiraceae bacterium]|nr:phosphodiester glycosidase family protein [Oscillospiraceae bacterium]
MKKRLLSALMAFALVASFTDAALAFSYADMTEELSVSSYEITEVAPDANYISLAAWNTAGKQNINAIEFNPKNPYTSLRAGKSAGYVYSTQTVNTIANNMSDKNGGDVAVAAVNGDFFTFGVGVPHGIFIDDGRILSTPPQYYAAFGITNDNKPFITRHGTILDKEFRINGILCDITGINNPHTKDAASLMLYTADYARSTKTGTEAYELLCRVISGDVRHGETLTFTVEKIFDAVGDTALSDGYIVLSAQGSRIADLKKLSAGETHSVSFRFNEAWANVKFAVGGIELLLKDGEVYSRSDTSNQPRTSVGIRPDGTVVMATFDGRGDAKGMSYEASARAMKALGCTDALNLDGGGSTTFVLRTPGAASTNIVNNVSGSSPRQVANALVLMNTAPTQSPTNLAVSPAKRHVLFGGHYKFEVTGAYDRNFKPSAAPSNISWSTSSVSKIDARGYFYADEAGTHTVTATSGRISGNATVTVYDRVDEIIPDTTIASVKAGETISFSASAKAGGNTLEASNELFTWSAPESLGKFTSPGTFLVSDTPVSGEIKVSYGTASATIKVETETPPKQISGFESSEVTFLPVAVRTSVMPGVKYETDPKFVYSGSRSLKVYYNFANTAGDVSTYYTVASSSTDKSAYSIKTLPKKLGMFVLGDGSGVTLRSIAVDAKGRQHYINFGKIEHTGWKYIEASMPEGLTAPFDIKAPVSLLPNPGKLTSGCLWFDGLRALYNDLRDDVTPPVITKAWPDENMTISGMTPSIGIIISDKDAGIDEDSIELYVNTNKCVGVAFDSKTGKISYTVKNALKAGTHTIYVRARDKAGNLLSREWKFEVK